MAPMDPNDAAWRKLADLYLRHALGELSSEAAIASVEAVAAEAEIDDDARVWKLLGLLTAAKAGVDRQRKRVHAARNAVAGVIATVELAESHLQAESAESPLLASASVEARRELLEAVRRSVLAAKSLTATLDRALSDESD